MAADGKQGQAVPDACDGKAVKVPVQGQEAFIIHEGVDGILEKNRVVILKGAGLFPNLMQGNIFLGADKPVDAALESVAFALPTGGNPTRSSGFFQNKRLDARTLQIDSGSKPRDARSDDYCCPHGNLHLLNMVFTFLDAKIDILTHSCGVCSFSFRLRPRSLVFFQKENLLHSLPEHLCHLQCQHRGRHIPP